MYVFTYIYLGAALCRRPSFHEVASSVIEVCSSDDAFNFEPKTALSCGHVQRGDACCVKTEQIQLFLGRLFSEHRLAVDWLAVRSM